ncbi:uncharacterized protein (DUF1684 family) [Conyzicola lurida]|uniref:Uncharacterized protein (DUF1684 family) n=1 Tax=Conyzicola lurida TaxID=1172621 RepID=A0A841AIG3_9MICO|nr:DUF1684 domain-containing protein [Conyzicola lurida]MBB5841782.1 uncharacterized protein (DUF1684 family) [Conyzicola lurida]
MTAFEVADWRRQVFAIYAAVRESTDLYAAHDLWRRERDRLFAEHPSSPLLPDDLAVFTGLPTRPYDPDWRFEVEVQEAEPARFDFETGTDGVVPFERLGIADVPGVGTLDVWRLASYGGGIFIPVRDALAGKPGGTYGGGRYLVDSIKGASLNSSGAPNTLVLDFNFAYNPSCAYDPAWACPLAPLGNRVAVEIPVGERYDGAH